MTASAVGSIMGMQSEQIQQIASEYADKVLAHLFTLIILSSKYYEAIYLKAADFMLTTDNTSLINHKVVLMQPSNSDS